MLPARRGLPVVNCTSVHDTEMELTDKVASLPAEAGVYLFKDALGTVLYVGKARSLKSRVRSYFLESRWTDAKTGSLVREVADFSISSSSTTNAKPWRSKNG